MKLMTLLRSSVLLAVALGLVACGNYDPEARLIRRAMTRIDDVAVEPPGTDRQEILDETQPEGGNTVQQAIEDPFCRPGEVDNRLPRCHARNIAVVLNTLTFFLVGVVDRLLQEPPTHRPEGRRVWGPIFLGGNSIRLDVERNPDDTFSYCLHLVDRFVPRNSRAARDITCADLVDETTGLTLVLTGDVEPAEDADGTLRSGAGTLVLDGAALASVSRSQMQGTFTIRYDNITREGTRAIDIDIDDIPLEQEPFETGAQYRFRLNDDLSGTFQFSLLADAEFVPNGSPAVLERFDITSQWQSDFAGRADSRVSGGDLGNVEAFQAQCWGDDLRTTFYEDLSRELGDPADCVFAEPLEAVAD
jgi:hypothetical protein